MGTFNQFSSVQILICISTLCLAISLSCRDKITQVIEGEASYYADFFHGGTTASGEIYDSTALTAAHLTLPFGTRTRITNLSNDHQTTVVINDRGPYYGDRIIDLSKAAARQLDMLEAGVVKVRIEVLAD